MSDISDLVADITLKLNQLSDIAIKARDAKATSDKIIKDLKAQVAAVDVDKIKADAIAEFRNAARNALTQILGEQS